MAYFPSELHKTHILREIYWNTIWHIGLYIEKLKNEVIYTMSRLIDKWNIKLNEKLVTILCLMHDLGMTS
jgi:hypothetical protein